MSNHTNFEKAAAEQRQRSFISELCGFLRQNKKWWLLPILVAMLLFAVLIYLSSTGLAPYIYALF